MPISPWYVGQTRPIWQVQAFQDAPAGGGPKTPLPIAGATITLHYKLTDANGNPTGNDIQGAGQYNITDGPNGKFTYTPDPSDTFVTNAGVYLMQFYYTYASNAIVKDDPFTFPTLASE